MPGVKASGAGMAELASLLRPLAAFDDDATATWLIRPEGALTLPELIAGFAERMVREGLPLWRVTCGVLTIHPEVLARGIFWRRGAGAREESRPHGIQTTSSYLDNPVALIHQGVGALRRRLEGAEAYLDFPLMVELKEEGGTDYVIMPLATSQGGQPNWISFASDRAGGFSSADLARIDFLLPLLALRVELECTYYDKRSLLVTYLGMNAADRVLAGTIKRGEVERLRAAIWFSDMRNFTRLSDRSSPEQVVAALDDYFGAIAVPVQQAGGEVLKFIGDAVLAIVPVQGDDPGPACDGLLSAAIAALGNLAEVNAGRAEPLRTGIGLHLGEVLYGNIGAPSRLDFTVIGPAVNEATRIEALTKRLERPILMSDAFAAHCSAPGLLALGFHPLKGVGEPAEVFTVPEAMLRG
jgi:adenylate cyclase